MYQGIFDTDFDKYMDDALSLFLSTGITTVFVNLEGFPEDWKENLPAVMKFFREHQVPSFLEYGEYPYVSADEIKKACA
jgi:ABC-type Fe3+-hydroxamate transport system substrate-binding protein